MKEQNDLFNENDYNIRVTKAKYESNTLTFCEDIFDGFDELYVVTYSYGLKFIEQIIKKFAYAEIIVGNDKLIEKQLAEIMANQEYNFSFAKVIYNQKFVHDYISETPYLLSRVRDETFRVFVPEDLISHQKIYLLKSKDGRFRTIAGSANFSSSAWRNKQLEEFICFDEKEAYDYFFDKFETLRELSTDEISIKAIEAKTTEEAMEELPVFKKIKAKNSLVIKSDAVIESETVLKTNNLNSQIFNALKSVKLTKDKQGNALIETKDVTVLFNELKHNQDKKNEQESNYPQFVLDYANRTATYNNQSFNLTPSREDVSQNIREIVKYFDSFDSCIEEGENNFAELKTLKRTYWKILNYMFLSPFLGYFRSLVHENDFDETLYPIYLIITGDSGIGKTSFIRFVQKLMLNDSHLHKYFAKRLKKKEFDSLKIFAKGVPLLIDEMDNERWGKLKSSVKADDFLFEQKYINHPCFIMPSNNITFLDSDIQRRCIHFTIDIRLDETKTGYKTREICHFLRSVSNALYCEYIPRMFDFLSSVQDKIQMTEVTERWIPDIYKGSSALLKSIFCDFGIAMPDGFDEFDINDYKGNFEKLENAKQILLVTYRANAEIFEKLKGQNVIQIDFTSYNNDWKNKRNINILARDLPRYFDCKQHGLKLQMNSEEFTKFTGIKIKRGIFG